jgi:hypothetical protein
MNVINKKVLLTLAGLFSANIAVASISFSGDVSVEADFQDQAKNSTNVLKADSDQRVGFNLLGSGATEDKKVSAHLGLSTGDGQFASHGMQFGKLDLKEVFVDRASIKYVITPTVGIEAGKLDNRAGFENAVVSELFRPNGANVNAKLGIVNLNAGLWMLEDNDQAADKKDFVAGVLRGSTTIDLGKDKAKKSIAIGLGVMLIDKTKVNAGKIPGDHPAATGNTANQKKFNPLILDVGTEVMKGVKVHGSYVNNLEAKKDNQAFMLGVNYEDKGGKFTIGGEYRSIQKDALLDDLTDKDFVGYRATGTDTPTITSGTDIKGFAVKGTYKVHDGLTAGMELFMTQPETGLSAAAAADTDVDDMKYSIRTYAKHTF